MNINDLINDGADNSTIVDPNLSGTNIDGKELRDFGNGISEFDPRANGFEAKVEDKGESDIDKALQIFDESMDKRVKEVEAFNDLIELNGEVSEEEVRETLGQSYITSMLKDGSGEKFEEAPETKVNDGVAVQPVAEVSAEVTELDELEQELEDMDNNGVTIPTVQEVEKPKAAPVETASVKLQPIPENLVKPGNVEIEQFKESVVDADGKSQEDRDMEALDKGDEIEADDDFEAKIKKELEKKLRPISNKLDLTAITISSKPVTANKVVNSTALKNKRVFTWPLIRSGKPLTIQSFSASELNVLNNNFRNPNTTVDVFKKIYEHITSYKGTSFEHWCKTTSYFDIDHIWMTIYGACFENSNYLPFSCNHCNQITVTDDTQILDMVKFRDDDAKTKFESIRAMKDNDPSATDKVAEYMVQISDNIVIGFIEPTIYTSIVENSMFDSAFKDKYNDIISILAYIGNIYQYSIEDGQLHKVKTPDYANNEVKTLKAKTIQYAKIIRALNSDEHNIIISHIVELGKDLNEVSYQMPEIACEHCKKTIAAEEQAASTLVFTRHQLVMFGA